MGKWPGSVILGTVTIVACIALQLVLLALWVCEVIED